MKAVSSILRGRANMPRARGRSRIRQRPFSVFFTGTQPIMPPPRLARHTRKGAFSSVPEMNSSRRSASLEYASPRTPDEGPPVATHHLYKDDEILDKSLLATSERRQQQRAKSFQNNGSFPTKSHERNVMSGGLESLREELNSSSFDASVQVAIPDVTNVADTKAVRDPGPNNENNDKEKRSAWSNLTTTTASTNGGLSTSSSQPPSSVGYDGDETDRLGAVSAPRDWRDDPADFSEQNQQHQHLRNRTSSLNEEATSPLSGEFDWNSHESQTQKQLAREDQSQSEACDSYCQMLDDMVNIGKATRLKPFQQILLTWYRPLMERIEKEQADVWKDMPHNQVETRGKGVYGGRTIYGPLIVLLKADKLAVLVMHEMVSLCLAEGNQGVPTLRACKQVAELVQGEVNMLRLNDKLGSKKAKNLLKHSGRNHVREVNKQAEKALESLEYTDWPMAVRIKLGAALIKFLLETASWGEDARPAFVHEVQTTMVKRKHGVISIDPTVYQRIVDEDVHNLVAPRFVPMLVPPTPWERVDQGGYLKLRCNVMRTRGDRGQKDALRLADMTEIYDGLNCLGKVPWKINGEILDIANEAWANGAEIGDLPSKMQVPIPPVPPGLKIVKKSGLAVVPPMKAGDDEKAHEELKLKAGAYRRNVRKIKNRNSNLHSLRCDMRIKMSIAEEFRDQTFYFPHNLDFRGRTYPVPPNLNILGSDFCRGILTFAESRPLGPRGMNWLKVHLANLYGQDKISFRERVEFVNDHLDQVRDSAERPLDGNGWWRKADSPWQCLGVCKDIIGALDSPDPNAYQSRIPVHQDGSCNGLQHYAALGRDAHGGAQVNLVPSNRPQDVYTTVCNVVKQKVQADIDAIPGPGATAKELVNHRYAKAVIDCIDRKVVKQTVMTSVYGVTFVGARKQIQNQIAEKFSRPSEMLSEEDETEVYNMSSYLAAKTMSALEDTFREARNIMGWLMSLAVLVAKEGQPVTWMTPLGLPVLQPYRRHSSFQVQTLLQGVHLQEENEHLPVAAARQRSAFPPNFVHSLDSTHMLLTAKAMADNDIPFAAVHDSYWVHAGNIDEMNTTLRECFVDLYSRPILEDLHASLCLRFPHVDFPPIPERGSLVLDDVKRSHYFFN